MPAIVSADTPKPSVPVDSVPAAIGDGGGNAEHATTTFGGAFTLTSSTGLIISCNSSEGITFHEDGTAESTSFTASSCTTNVPGCTASITSTTKWWMRAIRKVGSGVWHVAKNVKVTVTLGGGCPVSGSFDESGLLTPTISISGGVATITYSGSSSGSVSGPIGSATFSGTLTSSSGIGSDTQLVEL